MVGTGFKRDIGGRAPRQFARLAVTPLPTITGPAPSSRTISVPTDGLVPVKPRCLRESRITAPM